MEKIRIVIPVMNNLKYTRDCLEGIYNSTIYSNSNYGVDVYIVDNASTDGTKEFLESNNKVKYLRADKNKGFGGAVNWGLTYAPDYDYAIVLNNDVLIPKHLFEHMMSYMEDGSVGAVGPKSNYAGGNQGLPNDCCIPANIEEFSTTLYNKNKGVGSNVGILVGLCLLIRRIVIEEVGIFDEQFFPGMWEDTDYSIRVRLLGYKLIVARDCFLYHFGSKSMGSDSLLNFHINKQRFYAKWSKINKVGQKKRIIGSIRVKNGEPYIEATLTQLSKFCDEIAVLVSSQSTDNTYEICKKFPKVTKLVLHEETEYNETKDRNKLLEITGELNPEWIWLADSDEIPEDKLIGKIQELVNTSDPLVEGYIFKIDHLWKSKDESLNSEKEKVRCDRLWGDFFQCRLYKYNKYAKIGDAQIHSGSHPFIPGGLLCHSFLRIKHYGNLDPTLRQKKYEGYTKNDKEKDVNMILGRWQESYKKLYNKTVLADEDYYRHVVDETELVLKDWVEDNSISLCMIVKNEQDWIYKCLSTINKFVDEIILIDTGCTDKTLEIAQQFKKVKVLRYLDASEFVDNEWMLFDYSKARNYSLRQATGRWIVRLDADEFISEDSLVSLFMMIQNQDLDAYLFPICNVQTKDGKWVLSETCRLFKNTTDIYYSGLIHEEIEESLSILSKQRPVQVTRSPISITHLGYLRPEEERQKKYDRYAELAKRQLDKDPDNPKILYTLGVHYYCVKNIMGAMRYFRKAANLGFWMAYNDLGVIFLKKGNLLRAKEYFEKALDLGVKTQGHEIYLKKVRDNLKRLDIFDQNLKELIKVTLEPGSASM